MGWLGLPTFEYNSQNSFRNSSNQFFLKAKPVHTTNIGGISLVVFLDFLISLQGFKELIYKILQIKTNQIVFSILIVRSLNTF